MGDMKIKAYFGQKVDLGFKDKKIELSDGDENKIANCSNNLTLSCGSGSSIRVLERIKEGGEGIIYKCSLNGFVVKIYKKEKRNLLIQKKIERMVRNNPNRKSLCWPVDSLYYKSKFVGYLMAEVHGYTLSLLTPRNPKRVIERYPKYKKANQISIILSVLREFSYLHKNKIIIGDVKVDNVMVNNDTGDITFVDMDSIQIEEFPCIASTKGYDAPEVIAYRAIDKNGKVDLNVAKEMDSEHNYIYNNYYSNIYRTLEIEYHSIAVFLYYFMMGLFPYQYDEFGKVGEPDEYDDTDLQVQRLFPYSSEKDKTSQYCKNKKTWSHMPSFIKKAFEETFTGKRRLSPDEWIVLFEKYQTLLKENKINDPEADSAFPNKEIDYSRLVIPLNEIYVEKGFVMAHAVARVMKSFKDDKLKTYIKEVTEALKHKPIYIVDKYTFSLVYNIGILKKVKGETNV